jgi:hypothetical protein
VETLARGANFEITASGGVVRCSVINSPDVDREEGARCAQQMREVLLNRVLTAGSGYVGLVFDVRRGPEVFGPVTRGMLEGIFKAAESAKRQLAVRVGTAAMQRLQFGSLCRECAPATGKVVDDDADEQRWVQQGPRRSTPPS